MAYPPPPAGATLTAPQSTPAGAAPPPPEGASTTPPSALPALPAGAKDTPPSPRPTATPSGLYSVNPNVNVVGDYLTRWTKFGMGGIRDAFRPIVDALGNAFHIGIFDFNKGHHYAPNDPHLDGRAMDVDTVDGDQIGTTFTPKIRSFVQQALDQDPHVRVGVPKQIYASMPSAMKARAFVDAPAHIHVELSQTMPEQTVAPKGFTPNVSQGFVPPPMGATKAPPKGAPAIPPMEETANMAAGDSPVGGIISPEMAHSWINQVAGHQDLLPILANALMRDNATMPTPSTVLEQIRNPNSYVSKAWALYKRNPAQAMDEFGLGAPAQDQWMVQNRPGYEKSLQHRIESIPFFNALMTFGGEQLNPMPWLEGAGLGKAASLLGRISKLSDLGQSAARVVGAGTPLYGLSQRGGVEATQWAKGTIASINAPHQLLHLPETGDVTKEIFGGLDSAQKAEVVRLKQGLKPNPVFEAQHAELARRAKLLGDDMAQVESHQKRVGVLPPERTFNPKKFFPMKNSHDFGPQWELEQQLKGSGAPGSGGATSQHKVYADLDQAVAAGTLDKEFDPAVNFSTWRRQRLQRVAFEDSVARAPESVRRDVVAADFHNTLGVPLSQPWQQNINHSVQETLDRWLGENNAKYPPGHPQRYDLNNNPQWVRALNLMGTGAQSPTLQRSMVAPELWDFLRTNRGLQRYIGESSYLPGGEGPLGLNVSSKGAARETGGDWLRHYSGIMRNMIVSNFLFHPAVNVAGNDAAARGVYNLGGAQFSIGGYAYNAAKSLAIQAGLAKPERFVGGAEQYSHWLDRALKAGGIAEFGGSRYSAFGEDWAHVATAPPKNLLQRLDRALTKAGDFNRERTFGQKGEQAFAVQLFKDAVEKGKMSDAEAGQVVRQALGDYYNFDPKSPWSAFFFFMPWLKGNMKFWMNTLVRRPQYVTGVQHAMRNVGLQESPESYQGAYPVGDFTTYLKGGQPYTMPFVGRDVGHIAQAAGELATGNLTGAGAPVEQMLMGRATPVVRGANDVISTINAAFSGDVKGPETDWNMVVNPRAPGDVQFHQAAAYFASHFIPVPLFAYAVQDAARRGLSAQDVGQALLTAGGVGYFGASKLDATDKRQLKIAQKLYKQAYDRYRYHHGDPADLHDAWDRYVERLQEIGVINQ